MNLEPQQRLLEVAASGEGQLRAGRAVHLSKAALRQQNESQAIDVAPGIGQAKRPKGGRGEALGLGFFEGRRFAGQVGGGLAFRRFSLLRGASAMGPRRTPPLRKTERYEQRAEENRVAQVLGLDEAGPPMVIEASQAAQESAVSLSDGAIGVWKEVGQKPHLVESLEGTPRGPLSEDLVDLLEEPRRAALRDLTPKRADRFDGIAIDVEIEALREGDRSQHAHRVLAKPDARVADRSY